MLVMWTTVWWYQEKTHLSKLHLKWVSLFLTVCMATHVKLCRLLIVLHELFYVAAFHEWSSSDEIVWTTIHAYLLLLLLLVVVSSYLSSTVNLLLLLITERTQYNINIILLSPGCWCMCWISSDPLQPTCCQKQCCKPVNFDAGTLYSRWCLKSSDNTEFNWWHKPECSVPLSDFSS